MRLNVVTGKLEIIPRPEWDKRKLAMISLERADWEILYKHLYGQCIESECQDTLDLISQTFVELDKAVGKLPLTPGK